MTEQFSSMERDAFPVPYLSDETPEAVFHGQAVKTVAYLRVSTVQRRVSKTVILEYVEYAVYGHPYHRVAACGGAEDAKRATAIQADMPIDAFTVLTPALISVGIGN